MKIISYALMFLLLVLLQIEFLPFLLGAYLVPDLIFIGVITLGIREGGVAAMLTGCFLGFVLDSFSSFTGGAMIALVIAGFLAGVFSKNINRFGVQGNIIFLLVIVFIYHFTYYFLTLVDRGFEFFVLMINYVLPAAFYTCLLYTSPSPRDPE